MAQQPISSNSDLAGLSVAVIAGGGLTSLVTPRPEDGRRLDFYHYTDRAGFEGLTSRHAEWLPSFGMPRLETRSVGPFPGREDLSPPESAQSPTSISGELSALLAFVVHNPSAEMFNLTSRLYGPGWYVTDVPPDRPTNELLDTLWGGDERMRDRAAYWVRVRMEEFKARTPDPFRPRVRFIPIFDAMGISAEDTLWAESLLPAHFVCGGSRVEIGTGRVRVRRLHRRRAVLIPPYSFLINGLSGLATEKCEEIRKFLGTANRPRGNWPKDSPEAQAIDLVHSLAAHGKTEEALRRADELIKRYPRVADLHSNRGAVLAKLGRRQEAIECYLRALEIQPDFPPARVNLAASLMHLGQVEEALACINDLLLRHADSAEGWFNRGAALGRIAEWRWAIRAFERFLELAPEHPKTALVRQQLAQYRTQNILRWPILQIRRLARLWRRW